MRRILAIAVILVLFTSSTNTAESWTHELGLYGWLAGLEGTIDIASVVEDPVSATFDDLSSCGDFALAGHYEARGTKSVFLADISDTGPNRRNYASQIAG